MPVAESECCLELQHIIEVCTFFQLGYPVDVPQPVTGGLLHRMWRFSTTRGFFVVKELNAEIMQRPAAQDNYIVSERIASTFASYDIPAVVALNGLNGSPLFEYDGLTMMAFPWVDAFTLPAAAVPPQQAHLMGVLLARLHGCNLTAPLLKPPSKRFFPADQWQALARRCSEQAFPFAAHLQEILPDLFRWSFWHCQATSILNRTLVISHCDLDQKNVLWLDDASPVLIDWEAAGWTNPTFELVDGALNWSGLVAGEFELASFEAFLDGYLSAGGIFYEQGKNALCGCIGNWLGWLRYNLCRALGDVSHDAEQQALGISEVVNTLAILRSLTGRLEELAHLIDTYAMHSYHRLPSPRKVF